MLDTTIYWIQRYIAGEKAYRYRKYLPYFVFAVRLIEPIDDILSLPLHTLKLPASSRQIFWSFPQLAAIQQSSKSLQACPCAAHIAQGALRASSGRFI